MIRFLAGLALGLLLAGLVARIAWPLPCAECADVPCGPAEPWRASALECAELLEAATRQARACCGVRE